jgi:hypothetical protein
MVTTNAALPETPRLAERLMPWYGFDERDDLYPTVRT